MGALLGYIGENASQKILEGLARVNYLGRDGLGLATLYKGEIRRVRSGKGIEQAIREKNFKLAGNMGIGGIRFATHGRPTSENTPPFFDCKQNFAIISKGVITNFFTQKERLSEKGHIFKSRNDGEVFPHLLEEMLNDSFHHALRHTIRKFAGPFSFLLLAKHLPAIVAYSRENKLFIAQESEETGTYIASTPKMLENPYEITSENIILLTPEKIERFDLKSEGITNINLRTKKNVKKAKIQDFENFMIREIYQQPYALKQALATSQEKYVNLIARMISKGGDVFLTGCGTSYHATRLGGYLFREICNLSPSVVNAAEFRYYSLKDLEPGAVIIAVSQSGRTTDLLRTVRDAKRYGASIIGILNHLATPLMYSSNLYLPMGVGEENAVPATKSFLGSLVALYKIALKIAERTNINRETVNTLKGEMERLPTLVKKTIKMAEPVTEKIAGQLKDTENIFILGRGIDLPIALEGSLKLKEAAKLHSEGMTAGELRHGSITLLEKNFPAIFLIPEEKDAREDTYALISEANEIGGDCILITQETDVKAERVSNKVIKVPKVPKLISPFIKIIPLQLLSYRLGTLQGIEVDKPKALSKSVILDEE